MNRRTFLGWSASGVAALALGPLGLSFAQETARDLIVVSNAGDADGPSVSLIAPGTLEVLATVPLAGSYTLPATRWDFARDLIWAGRNESVVAYRLSTGEQVAEVPTGSRQNYTEITPDGRWVLNAARFSDSFQKIGADPDQADFGRVVAEFSTYEGARPCDMTILSDGRYAYAPDRGGDTLSVLSVESFERIAEISVASSGDAPLEPYMATVSPAGGTLLVENAIVRGGSDTGSESIFDLTDPMRPEEVARLTTEDGLGVGPLTSEITEDGRWGIVICRDSSELSILDLPNRAFATSVSFPEGSNPLTGTFSRGTAGEMFFVPLPGRDAVAAVSVPDFEVVSLIAVGARPTGIVHLRAALPERTASGTPLGVAMASSRTFADDCPDLCCGPV